MVDHWPVSTILDESEQKLIKEHREGKVMYLSDAEKEMVTALRREQELIVNEQNEQSPNMKAVEDIERLKTYLKDNGIRFSDDVATNILMCLEHRSNLLKEARNELDQINSTGIVDLEVAVNSLIFHGHKASVDGGWWNDPATGEDLHGKRNVPEMLMLIVSEIAEAMEGYRKNKMDDKLPHHKMITVELADGLLRIGDLAGALDLPVGKATKEKRDYNLIREDHKAEQRLKSDGKKF